MVQSIISEINNITPDKYLKSFPILKRLSQEALQIIPVEIKYNGVRIALENVIWVMDNTADAKEERFQTWLFHVFRSKKEHALEALDICIKKEKSPYIYSY